MPNAFKVIVLGDSYVGKTSLLYRYCYREIAESSAPTIGLDFFKTTVEVEGETLQLNFWDTAGQERFHNTMTSHYYRKIDGVIFVYDATNYESFKNLTMWVEEYEHFNLSDVPRILIGNKYDRESEITVRTSKACIYAQNIDAGFFATSVTDSALNEIDNIFQIFAQKILQYKNSIEIEEDQLITLSNCEPKKDKCWIEDVWDSC